MNCERKIQLKKIDLLCARYIPIRDAHFMEQCDISVLIMEFKATSEQLFQWIKDIKVTTVPPLPGDTLLRNSMIIKFSSSLWIC